jgi:tryptophan-rich sensory protein
MAREKVMRISEPAPRGRWYALFLCMLGVAVTGGLGALASLHAGEFYARLVKPQWAPPPGVFSPVWTVLYLMMGFAAWLAWRARGPGRGLALQLFAAQLALNALWSWLFFRWHLGALALVEICILWFAILTMLTQFWRLRPLAGALLIPYLLWVGFATALNAAVWRLNPTLL